MVHRGHAGGRAAIHSPKRSLECDFLAPNIRSLQLSVSSPGVQLVFRRFSIKVTVSRNIKERTVLADLCGPLPTWVSAAIRVAGEHR